MLRRFVVTLGLLLLAVTSAAATSGEWVDVTCPVCGNRFEGWEYHSTNTFGGSDRDFCHQAAGDQVFLLTCWTCPRCAYTGFQDDFDPKELSMPLVARLKAEKLLEPAVPLDAKTKRTDEIPAWVRWDLRVQVLDIDDDATTEDRAWARLRTAHTQRFGIDTPDALRPALEGLWKTYFERVREKLGKKRGYERAVTIARALEADAGDPELPLTASERRARLLMAARIFTGRGESPATARVIAALRRDHPELPEAARTMVADLETRIGREQKYVASAVPLYEALTKEKDREPKQVVALRYLVGELRRKLGQHEQALRWLEPLAEEEIPEGLRTWVSEAIEKTKSAAAD